MGAFFTFEGGDGSGKGTQTSRTVSRLDAEGRYELFTESYPRYKTITGKPIGDFLDKQFGNPHPVPAGIMYSADRLANAAGIRETIAKPNGVAVIDRYTYSNAGHNGGKFRTREERLAYFAFLREYEFEGLGIPKPDHNFIFLTPPDIAQGNVDKKVRRDYTEKTRDLHEENENHLADTYESYLLLAETYPEEFTLIDTVEQESGRMRSIEDLNDEVMYYMRPLLDELIPIPK